ncbi:MAG: UDP-3-O-(3-hydroxymyristoyl)glucosamine N-acyltransferase [Rickettsiales bacterium]|jgi:UDP-3-O-[3-hydroxymyristoyl] glucosamine N-acyltransferase|nr:UDP-3-O-(3-hydroxymyristoyl)glucosamine N-acyltransferase [Rickettsiales bacterium]
MLEKLLTRFLAPKASVKLTAGEIADKLGLEIRGNRDTIITGLAPIADAKPGQAAFYSAERNSAAFKILPIEVLKNTKASVILLQPEQTADAPKGATLVVSDSPRRDVIKIMEIIFAPKKRRGIDRSAKIARGVFFRDKKSVFIGPNVVIESGCAIEPDVEIESCAYIGGRSIIGRGTTIGPNAYVANTTCGADCEIANGASIGKHGFGYSIVDGKNMPIPHLGRVVLGDRIDVGANSVVDRGVMADTILGSGTKLDSLVMVGHNVVFGEECFAAGQSGFAGGTIVGSRAKFGGQAGAVNKISVGDDAEIGTNSCPTKDVPAGSKMLGFPAVPANDFLRMQAFLRRSIKQ